MGQTTAQRRIAGDPPLGVYVIMGFQMGGSEKAEARDDLIASDTCCRGEAARRRVL